MNHYKRHLGDFARDTSHLSQGQVGAYDLLLDWYYSNERGLPTDPEDVYRIAKAYTKEERKNVDKVRAFFDADGRHKRCDAEIAKYQAQAAINRETGKKGGRPKNETEPKANGNRIGLISVSEQEPIGNPSHKPLAIREESTLSAGADGADLRDPIPYAAIVDAYHAALPALPAVRRLSDARRRKLKARWIEDKDRQSVEYWREFFEYVAGSDFLTGRNGKWTSCDLEWLIEAKNHLRVTEGKYANREAA